MGQIYRYPNTSDRITRTNLTQKCGVCNSAPILQDSFFGPSSSTILKSLSTAVSATRNIQRSIAKRITGLASAAGTLIKRAFKNVVAAVANTNTKRTSIALTKSKTVSASGVVQRIKSSFKTIVASVATSANRIVLASKQILKQIASTSAVSRLISVSKTFIINVSHVSSIIKSVGKRISSSMSLSAIVDKFTTIVPKIYYKTIEAISAIANTSFVKAISSNKSTDVGFAFGIRKNIVVTKSAGSGIFASKTAAVGVTKTANVHIVAVMSKLIRKAVTLAISIVGSILKQIPIDRVIISISASFSRVVSYFKTKVINKSVVKVDPETIAQQTQTTSYVKEKYTKTTIE